MRLHLEHSGYSRVHALGYTVDTVPLEDAVQEVSAQMMKICGSKREPVFVVGQSMGGLVANRLHNHGWQVARAVCIASPLHGARLLGTLHSWLPACVWNALDKEAYQTLRRTKTWDQNIPILIYFPPHEPVGYRRWFHSLF